MADIPQRPFEDRVMSYLFDHQDQGESIFAFEVDEPLAQVQFIMREILLKLNKRILCKDRYDNLKNWHNQYPLFDLDTFIPDFCMDDEMIKKLSFRETLLVSELDTTDHEDSRIGTPNPVGALCLNIEALDAILPEGIKMTATDEELELEVIETLQRAKQVAGALSKKITEEDPKSQLTLDEIDNALQATLEEYEAFLKNEMSANATKFLVHLSSQFSVGINGGSRITAWVDRNMHTLEEKRTEYAETPDELLEEKSLYVALQRQKYYIRHVNIKDREEDKKYYSLAKARNLVCEGANFILMRYLAITKYVGQFELSTTYINGDLCRNVYECTGPMMGTVNNKSLEICKIYRSIMEKCGLEHNCVTVLTLHGRIVSQEWDGCRVIINMNPLQHVSEGMPSPWDRLDLDKTWFDDMEMFAQYLDVKTEAEMKMKTYMADHAEVKDILADYLNNILLLKPQNILSYTVDFFQSLCPLKMEKLKFDGK